MSNGSNLAVGASVGAVAGCGTGAVLGLKKAKEILKPYCGNSKKPSLDAYIALRQKANEANVMSLGKLTKIKDAFARIATKATMDFNSAMKSAKSTKIKLIAGGVAVGAILGTVIAALTNKKADNK